MGSGPDIGGFAPSRYLRCKLSTKFVSTARPWIASDDSGLGLAFRALPVARGRPAVVKGDVARTGGPDFDRTPIEKPPTGLSARYGYTL
jgi:hypothetical protein